MTAQLVAVVETPLALDAFADLARQFPDCVISSGPGGYWIRTRGEICACMTCDDAERDQYAALTGDWLSPTFIVCVDCGNKRCPKATHHDHACTGSNEPGQAGSVFA